MPEPLGEDENPWCDFVKRLQKVYDPHFRHLYSEIFGIISSIDASGHGTIQDLSTNLKSLYEECQDDKNLPDEFKAKVQKLYDHVNLDIARIEYTRKISDNIATKNTTIIDEIQNLKNRSQEMQKDYVTILGIFSSIILTFVAGMVFSSSILSNMDKVTIYRLIFIMALIALMIFNLFHFQFEYIQKISGKKYVTAKGETSVISTINVFICIVMVIDFILWLLYWYRFS